MLNLSDVKRIMTETEAPVLSLYLNVDPGYQENQAATPAWRVWFKNALRDIESKFDRDQQRVWQPIRQKVEDFLTGYRPESKGLVLFLGSNSQETIELPLSIENGAAYGEPLVAPLFWTLDEYERYLIVLVDQQEARFLTAYLGSAGEQERMEIGLDEYGVGNVTELPPTTNDEHRARFLRNVLDRLNALSGEHETTRIILGGAAESANGLRSLMNDTQSGQVVDVLPIPLRTPPHEIVARIQPVAHDYERQFETRLLDGVIDLAKSGGRGALGRVAVIKALNERRVDMIIAPWPLADEELLRTLPTRALESGSTIELVHGEALQKLNEEGGLAARLHYAT